MATPPPLTPETAPETAADERRRYARPAEQVGRIVCTLDTLVGKPRFDGTRISVELVLEHLADGWTMAQLLEDFPALEEADLLAAFRFAAEALDGYRVWETPPPGALAQD